jgi:hypothetical protein
MDISGEQIIKSVYKASLVALFAIGVKSPDNVEKFTASFTQALDREFLKIGLLPKPDTRIDSEPLLVDSKGPVKSLDDPLDKLQLMNIIKVRLKKVGITTVGELMTEMQKAPLTAITGVKEKSAIQIVTALKLWNSH